MHNGGGLGVPTSLDINLLCVHVVYPSIGRAIISTEVILHSLIGSDKRRIIGRNL